MDADQELEHDGRIKLKRFFFMEKNTKNTIHIPLIYKNFTDEELKNYNLFTLQLIFKMMESFIMKEKFTISPIYKTSKGFKIYIASLWFHND